MCILKQNAYLINKKITIFDETPLICLQDLVNFVVLKRDFSCFCSNTRTKKYVFEVIFHLFAALARGKPLEKNRELLLYQGYST